MEKKKNNRFSLIDKKIYNWLIGIQKVEDGYCIKKFKADYVVENLKKYNVGDFLDIDNKKLEIIQKGKDCFSDCPYLNKYKKSCLLKEGVAFAK